MNPDIGMDDDDVNIDVSVVVIDVDVIVMSDFDVSVVIRDGNDSFSSISVLHRFSSALI